MKKIASVSLVAVLALTMMFALTACGGGADTNADAVDLTGTTYALSGAEIGGQTVTGADLSAVLGEITYEFKADGVVTATMAGTTIDGTWSLSGTTATVTIEGDSEDGTLSGNDMTFERDGTKMIFTKK